MDNNALDMAKFLHLTNKIKPDKKREYLDRRWVEVWFLR